MLSFKNKYIISYLEVISVSVFIYVSQSGYDEQMLNNRGEFIEWHAQYREIKYRLDKYIHGKWKITNSVHSG